MDAALRSAEVESSATLKADVPPHDHSWVARVGRVWSVVVVLLAVALLLGYGWLALRWQSQPYLGMLVSPTLTVEAVTGLSGEPWPAYESGLRPGDRLLGLDGVTLDADYRVARRQVADLLAAHQPGDAMALVVERHTAGDDSSPGEGELRCTESRAAPVLVCTATLTLARFPLVDFASQFGVSFGVGVVFLVLAGLVLRARWRQPVAHHIAAYSAAMAVLTAGAFDIYTTHALSPWVPLAAIMLVGGLLMTLALTFPGALTAVQRRPWLRLVPLAVALAGMAFVEASALPADPAAFWRPWELSALFVLLGAGLFLLSLVRRLGRTASPVLRDQCAVALVGALLSVLPLLVWLVGGGMQAAVPQGDTNLPFSLVTPFFLLFPLGLVYALSQDQPVYGDAVLGLGTVYGIMALGVTLGYALLVTGVSLLVGSALSMNNPLLVAVTVFLVALLFVPVRDFLERRVNETYYRTRRLYQRRVENLTQELARVSTLGGIVEALQAQLQETLDPGHVFLFFPDDETGYYIAHGIPRPETDIRFAPDSPLVALLSRRARPLYLEPGQPLPPELAPERARLAVLEAPVLAPLSGRERLSGILAVGPRRSGERYRDEALHFIQSLADQAALAVERALVIANLEQRLRELDVLGQVAQAVNFTVEFDDLLELIYAQTNRVINAPDFYIVLRDPHIDELYYAFYSENDERLGEREGVRWRMGRDLLSEIVRTGQPMRVENYGYEAARRGSHAGLENLNLKAWMGVPLNAPGHTLGVICVGSADPTITYSDEQLKILWQIADQAATAIDKARLFRETQVRARQLTVLNEISTRLATVFQDPDQLLRLITESAVSILEAEAGSLLMIDPETGELEFKVAIGSESANLVGTRLPPGTGLVGTVADRGEPLIVNDTTRDPRWFSGVDADTEFRTITLLAAPLIASTGVIGVLEVINKRDGGVFVEDDKRLLTTFAGQAAIAIENARLFQMTDQQLALRVQELDTMQRIDRELNETLDLQHVLDITLDWALRESEADAGAIGMVVDEPPGLQIVTHYGYSEEVAPRLAENWPLGQGVVGRVLRTGRPELISDVRLDEDYVEVLPGAGSQIVVPFFTGGKVRGVIILESTRQNAFNLLTLDFVSRLAEHASPALANASLFARLERANEARSEFVGVVAHELKTPMTSIRGFADLLLGGVVGPLNDQQKNFLSTIRINVERMATLVSDLNDVTKLQTNRMSMEMAPIDFRDVVLESLRPLQKQIEDKGQSLRLHVPENLPPVYADYNRMIQVLTNLVSNAHKYTPSNGVITIFAEAGRNVWGPEGPAEVLHFYVQDDGIGISQADQERLFTPYFRTNNPMALEQPGTGLGLVIVRGIVEQHGGRIWVESALGEGATFHVTVPLASAVRDAEPAARQDAAD